VGIDEPVCFLALEEESDSVGTVKLFVVITLITIQNIEMIIY
jgi:hypothetical protein